MNKTGKSQEQSVLKDNRMGPARLPMVKARGQSLSRDIDWILSEQGPRRQQPAHFRRKLSIGLKDLH